MPGVPHKTQEEPQKPREYEQEVALPMEVVDVDEMVVLDGKPATRTYGVGEGDEIINVWKSAKTPASAPTQRRWSAQRDDIPEVHGVPLEGSGQCVRAAA